MRVFISSVQKEFAAERKALAEYLSGDPLLRRFFETFLFERDVPASDRRPDAVYLDEVRNCDLYLGLFGDDYGWENKDGLSPTHLELNEATRQGKTRLNQAKDFVLSKIDLWVGTREHGTQVPTKYEIPQEVVAEAIVNAIAHRDYTSNASVQVMLFKDRLEIWNPGSLPPTLTLEKLRGPHASVPHNPLLAEPMYLTKYIERMGTGIRDMIHRCRKAGLPEPEIRIDAGSFVLTIRRKATGSADQPEALARPSADPVTDPVTDPVERVVLALAQGELAPSALWERLGLKHRPTFRENYLRPALEQNLIEPTIPEKPTSRLQKYRLTEKGQTLLAELEKPGGKR